MFKLEKLWVAPAWEQQLSQAGLLEIESMTTREFDWFERPNKRLGGWSGVSRVYLNPEASAPERIALFLKIQSNHCYRTIGNGLKKRLTFERELDAFEALQGFDALPELVLFAKWRQGSDIGSIFMTKALDGFVELQDWIQQVQQTHPDQDAEIRKALKSVAETTRTMHQRGWAHFAYKPKHVFIGEAVEGKYPIRLIDFERARRPLRAKVYVTEDLSRFLRHSLYLTRDQKLQFLHDYFQTETFSPKQAKWVTELEKAKSLRS